MSKRQTRSSDKKAKVAEEAAPLTNPESAGSTGLESVLTDDETSRQEGDEDSERPAPIRRSSSLFSLDLDSTAPLDPPDDEDIKKFTSDDIHFSMIRNLHLADFITMLNGFSGFYSIISCLRFTSTNLPHYVQRAHFFILLGLFFDFFDGRVARLRNRSSLLGQELDSLADLISFGVAPASIAFAIGFQSTIDVLILSFFVLCGLTRLARFNVTVTTIPKDLTGKSKYFEGLPIPTSLFIVGLMAFWVHKDWIQDSLPLGTVFTNTFFEFHPIVLIFGIHGSALISKSLKIPKP
ncbi:CDP-diacylglycerol-serine O-phosphatidyltransferase [Wickerhamomyces ciferrii]|uniref:CDP-diacylglycerol--serine O-phosphatidyltransferase n=2 Tax=Wickerhamomyces ciferrii TaxID=1041607 RepID=K0KJ69_WICCF|nr:CDP-diacylglycerol-serine O-phosphatidyltransferase [Wickerhamomyces ciferrii]AEX09414.1 phosphatidylserine synthase [Wickerhamomyces ciferrii]CCH41158.1 CDP-diacylglycerol-serine O-phosphatidyltransferase [Wickerhamomyces ciferrii]